MRWLGFCWVVCLLLGCFIGWRFCNSHARQFCAARPGAVEQIAGSQLFTLIDSVAEAHGWDVVGFTTLLNSNGGGMMLHVEPDSVKVQQPAPAGRGGMK